MKLLVISDAPDPGLWDYFSREKLQGADAILSCGDLPAAYLSFLVTMANRPLFYVHGNHDVRYEQQPPEGCECIDGRVVEFKGWRILGLGGCMASNGAEWTFWSPTPPPRGWGIWRTPATRGSPASGT